MVVNCWITPFFGSWFFGGLANVLYDLKKCFVWRPIEFYIAFPKRDGFVNTIGLNGFKSWNGNMIGEIINNGFGADTGVIGFTGIKIGNGYTVYTWLIGTAYHVKINYTDYVPPTRIDINHQI
jgi:hypothetical protein